MVVTIPVTLQSKQSKLKQTLITVRAIRIHTDTYVGAFVDVANHSHVCQGHTNPAVKQITTYTHTLTSMHTLQNKASPRMLVIVANNQIMNCDK